MKDIFVDNYIISTPLIDILKRVQSELMNGKLRIVEQKDDQIAVNCPVHKDGKEEHPSCYLYCGDGELPVGAWHCFTCGSSGQLWDFIGHCFDKSGTWGKRWLIANFGEAYSETMLNLESIDLSKKNSPKGLDESILDQFESYHPYMTQRKLSDAVIKEFDIKYDPLTKSIVFPVRDRNGKLSFLTRRTTAGKKFYIDKGADKKNIYLLYNIINKNLDNVYICESQINCLYLESLGYNAVAMIGAGCSDEQIAELNKTGVRHFIVALDPDEAGRKGTERLCKKLSKSKFVDVILYPDTRDINDLTEDEIKNLKMVDRSEYFSLQRP